MYFTPNPSGYTAEKYFQDVMAMLPFALKEYQKSGRMISCGHCGATHNSAFFYIQRCTAQNMIADVEIVSVCDNVCCSCRSIQIGFRRACRRPRFGPADHGDSYPGQHASHRERGGT